MLTEYSLGHMKGQFVVTIGQLLNVTFRNIFLVIIIGI